jgi:membrane associated rhomboid family serine protease
MVDFAQAPAAYSILILFIVVSLLGLRVSRDIIERNLLRPYRVVKNREIGPLIGSGFIHADMIHLLVNAFTMFVFAPALEANPRMGTVKFVALYFAGLLLSNLGSVWKHHKNPDYALLGASGAIMAVMFAYIVYYPTSLIYYFGLPIPAPLFAFAFMGYSWWASKRGPSGIAHDAHLDGAIIGVLFVFVTDFAVWRYALARIFS